MNHLEFNSNFFSRNDDPAYKIAVMITRFGEIPLYVQEFLSFANKDSIVGNVNLLTFTELFNELYSYSVNWIINLSNLQDENDWEFYRSKFITRLQLIRPINPRFINDSFHQFKNSEPHLASILKNSLTIWANSEFYSQTANYIYSKNSKVWDLWKCLSLYSNVNIDSIIIDSNLIRQFSNSIDYRNQDSFYKKYNIILDSNPIIEEINKIKHHFSIISLKNNLDRELPIYSKIKNILKI